MKPEIKQRIEQIKAGQVPEGYKRTKIGIMPTEWKDVHFGDLFITKNRYAEDLDKYPLYSLTIEDGITAKSERYERSHLVKKENAYKVVEPNDFAYNPMNVRFGAVARHKENIPVSVSGYYDIFTTKENADLKFMDNFLVSDRMIKYYNKVSTGSLVEKQRVHYSEFIEFNLPLPSIKEREKIAKILSVQDRIIELYQRKIEELQKMKKVYLSKMFPKKGENVPEWRFPQFTGAWEQRKVSELFRVTRGYVLAATQTETTKTDEKPYPVYSSQTKDKGLMGYYKDYLYEDAITWTTDGANAGTVNYRAGKFYCTNVCGVLLSNEVKANQMIAEALNSVAKGYVSYVGNPKLMNNVMADIVIQIPTQAEEREQLSSFFAKLDNLITLHQRKLEETKKYKKTLMQLLLTGIVRCKW